VQEPHYSVHLEIAVTRDSASPFRWSEIVPLEHLALVPAIAFVDPILTRVRDLPGIVVV
jgi:hypothetical protein